MIMSDCLENLGKNDFSDELVEQSTIEDVQGLDDFIETGTFYETGFDEINFSNDNKVNNLIQTDNPNKFVENSFKRQYKTVKKIELNEKMEVLEKLENTMEGREIKVKDGSHFNDTPDNDIQEAFDYVDVMFNKESPEWQENACRYVENLENKLSDISNDYNDLKTSYLEISEELNKIVADNGLTPENCSLNSDYVAVNEKYLNVKEKFDSIELTKSSIEAKIEAVKPYIKEKTTFVGFNNTDFKNAYNACITNFQGEVIENVGGTCSENSIGCSVNQQFGTSYTEKDMFTIFHKEGQCTYKEVDEKMSIEKKKEIIGANGGTTYIQRATIAEKLGLSYFVDTGKKVSLDKMENLMKNGYSINLGLKAEDLSQKDLSPRKHNFGLFGVSNNDVNKVNHMVSVVGFSHNEKGNISGVWINDTGGFSGSNRIFISKEKFYEMSKNTIGFSVESCIDANKIKNVDNKNSTKVLKSFNSNSELGKLNKLGDFNLEGQKFESNSKVNFDGNSFRTDDYGKVISYYDKDSKTWVMLSNNKYEINGYKYETNLKGQIVSCEGNLHYKNHVGRKSISDSIPNRLENDDKGHLIADMFDGSNKIDNIVPMNRYLNQIEYRNIEMKWKDALIDNKDVYVKIKIKYDSNNRPSKFSIVHTVDGVRSVTTFNNDGGGNKNESRSNK